MKKKRIYTILLMITVVFTPCLVIKKDNDVKLGIFFNTDKLFKRMLKNGFQNEN